MSVREPSLPPPLLGEIALVKRESREHEGDDEAKGDGPECDSLASCSGFAAGDDVFGLQRCGLAFFLSASFCEPLLSGSQIFSPQNKAVIPAVCVPLNRSGEQPRVRTHPLEIGVERAEQEYQ